MARHRLEQTNDVWAHRYFTPRNATTCLFHDSSRLPLWPSRERKEKWEERKKRAITIDGGANTSISTQSRLRRLRIKSQIKRENGRDCGHINRTKDKLPPAAKDATGRKKRRVCKRPVSGSLIRRYKLQAAEGIGYV